MYQAGILVLGIVPAALFLALSRLDRAPGAGPSPMWIMAWVFALGHSVKSVYLAWAVGSGAPFRTMDLSRDMLDLGQAAIVLCALSIAAGYMGLRAILAGRVRSAAMPAPPRIDMRPVHWGLFAAALALMALFFHQMGFAAHLASLRLAAAKWHLAEETGIVSALGFLTLGGDVLLILFLHRHARAPRPRLTDPRGLAVAFCCLCYLLASRRSGVLIVIVMFLLVAPRGGARAAARRLSILGAALACLAMAGQVRVAGGARVGDLDLAGAAAVTAGHVLEGAYFLDPAKTAVIVAETRARDLHLMGESYLMFLAAPVPRLLWPEKPDIRIGPWVAREILGYDNASGVPPGGVGELFLNFGWGGVMGGGLLVGVLLAGAWERHRAAPGPTSRVGFAILATCVMLYLVGDFSSAALAFIKYRAAHAVAARYWLWKEAVCAAGEGASPSVAGPVRVRPPERIAPLHVRRGAPAERGGPVPAS